MRTWACGSAISLGGRGRRRPFALILASCALAAATAAAADSPPSPSAQPLDPYAIYARCVRTMSADPVPPYMTYVLQVDADHINISRGYDEQRLPETTLHFRISHRQQRYRVWYRSADQRSLMQDLQSKTVSVVPPVPWALDFRSPALTNDSSPPEQSAHSGSVTTNEEGALIRQLSTDQSHAYLITLAADTSARPDTTYHLLLQSVSGDPNAHALRELYVDQSTFRAREVVMEVGEHTLLYGGRLELRATFSAVGPYWLNTSGIIQGRGYYTIFFLNGSYVYTASDFAFPQSLPDSYFRIQGGASGSPAPGH